MGKLKMFVKLDKNIIKAHIFSHARNYVVPLMLAAILGVWSIAPATRDEIVCQSALLGMLAQQII